MAELPARGTAKQVMRVGKTARDRSRGVLFNRIANRRARVAWQQSGRDATNKNFPAHTCNGKKNRR